MRNIYTDEAGIAAPEWITIVVALLVHTDTQWLPAAQALSVALAKAPTQYRSGLTFHARKIKEHSRYPEWPAPDRQALMTEVMGIPMRLGIPVVVAAVKRHQAIVKIKGMRPEMNDHAVAFSVCMGRADEYIRINSKEMSQIIADRQKEMAKFLAMAVRALRKDGITVEAVVQKKAAAPEKYLPLVHFKIERVVDQVHFMESSIEAPLLQIADACAFGYRRYFSGYDDGPEFLKAIIGEKNAAEVPRYLPSPIYNGVYAASGLTSGPYPPRPPPRAAA